MKQISIVLEVDESYDDLVLLADVRNYLLKFREVRHTGTHVKIVKDKE